MPRIKSTPIPLYVRQDIERRKKWRILRASFQRHPNLVLREHRALATVVTGLRQLAIDIEAASTPEAFEEIATRAKGELWEVAIRCVFKDPLAVLFLRDIDNYCQIASSILAKQVVDDELDEDWCFWRDQAYECALTFQKAMF